MSSQKLGGAGVLVFVEALFYGHKDVLNSVTFSLEIIDAVLF